MQPFAEKPTAHSSLIPLESATLGDFQPSWGRWREVGDSSRRRKLSPKDTPARRGEISPTQGQVGFFADFCFIPLFAPSPSQPDCRTKACMGQQKGPQGMLRLGGLEGSGHPLPRAGQWWDTPGCPGLHPATHNYYCIIIPYVSTKEQKNFIGYLDLDLG